MIVPYSKVKNITKQTNQTKSKLNHHKHNHLTISDHSCGFVLHLSFVIQKSGSSRSRPNRTTRSFCHANRKPSRTKFFTVLSSNMWRCSCILASCFGSDVTVLDVKVDGKVRGGGAVSQLLEGFQHVVRKLPYCTRNEGSLWGYSCKYII